MANEGVAGGHSLRTHGQGEGHGGQEALGNEGNGYAHREEEAIASGHVEEQGAAEEGQPDAERHRGHDPDDPAQLAGEGTGRTLDAGGQGRDSG